MTSSLTEPQAWLHPNPNPRLGLSLRRLGPVRLGPKIIKYSTWRHNQYGDTAKNI